MICDCGCRAEGPSGAGLRVRGTVGNDDVDIRVGGKDSDCGCCAKDCNCRRRDKRRKPLSRSRRELDDDDQRPIPQQPPDYFASRFRYMPTRDRVGILEDNVEVLRGDIHGLERKLGAVAPQYMPQFGRRFSGLRPPFVDPRYTNPGFDDDLDLFKDEDNMMDFGERMPSRSPRWAARQGWPPVGRSQVPPGYYRGSGSVRRPQGTGAGHRMRPGMRINSGRQRSHLFQDLLDDDEEDEGGPANVDNGLADDDSDPDWEDGLFGLF
jgi:hypothetical protein